VPSTTSSARQPGTQPTTTHTRWVAGALCIAR
jgi:hypothetical protein